MILIQEQNQKIAASAIKDFGKFSFRHNAVWLALSRTVGLQFFVQAYGRVPPSLLH